LSRKTIYIIISVVAVLSLVGASSFAATSFRDQIKIIGKNTGNSVKASISDVSSTTDKKTAHLNAKDQSDSTCTACHDMTTAKFPWHKMHLTISLTDFKCSTCHKEIQTETTTSDGTVFVNKRTMDGTVYIDRTVCLKCHRDKFPAFSAEHQKVTWVKEHKNFRGTEKKRGEGIPTMVELEADYPQCFICHKEKNKELNFCKDCHEFHDHNDEWINGKHGRTALLKTDFECVKRCHDKKTWCTWECHEGVTLPHNIPKWTQFWKDDPGAPWWRAIHFQVAAEKGDSVCRRCHDSPRSLGEHPDFCMECHHEQFYQEFPDQLGTPWKPYAMKFVRNNGSYRCWQCHMPDFCVTCHTTDKKPPPHTTFVGPR